MASFWLTHEVFSLYFARKLGVIYRELHYVVGFILFDILLIYG